MAQRFILNEVSYFGAGARKELPEVLNRMGLKKALKNYTDPVGAINMFGADALRLFLMHSAVVKADDLKYSDDGVLLPDEAGIRSGTSFPLSIFTCLNSYVLSYIYITCLCYNSF